jgi:hypothetical protein
MSDKLELPDGIEINDDFRAQVAYNQKQLDKLQLLVSAFKDAGIAVGDMETQMEEASKSLKVLKKLADVGQ